jgi:hypothetical protein
MKKVALIMVLGLVAPIVQAQDFDSEIEFFQSAYGLEKKAIVENFINLSGESATAFWIVYNEYETERKSLGKERMAVLSDYAEQYESITNEQADALMLRALANRASKEKLMKKYYKKVKKVTDAKTATQFIQLEAYLGAAIQYALLESIPFVGE